MAKNHSNITASRRPDGGIEIDFPNQLCERDREEQRRDLGKAIKLLYRAELGPLMLVSCQTDRRVYGAAGARRIKERLRRVLARSQFPGSLIFAMSR